MSQATTLHVAESAADPVALAERLIRQDTSTPDGIRNCVEYLAGWLEARGIQFVEMDLDGLPVMSAKVGDGPVTVVLHAHIDVVPGRREQFSPWQEGGDLWGRGAYDMKGATAAMLAVMADLAAHDEPLPIKVRFLLVPDEESDEEKEMRGTQFLIEQGQLGDFVICGEPTDMHVGVQAKGVLAVRIQVEGRSAHGATPWLGTNAILRGMDVYEALLRLPFVQESSTFFERPSINLGRISGGDRMNRVPDVCSMDVDIRFLPEQPIDRIREELGSLPGCTVHEMFYRPPAYVSVDNPFVTLLRDSISECCHTESLCVGRDGTNDGTYFLQRGIPSVEFGPVGSGHHGPAERVEVSSLLQYRSALLHFLTGVARERERLVGVTEPATMPPDREAPRTLLQ